MKRTIYITLIFFVSFLSGCENYLDQDPEQMNTIDKVFSNRDEVKDWHARLFSDDYFRNMLHDDSFYQPFFCTTDNSASLMNSHATAHTQGTLNPAQTTTGYGVYFFSLYYQAIRHANIFLENIDKSIDLSESEKSKMVSEAIFMRAMYHFWLLQIYGPIPIVENTVSSKEGSPLFARNSMEECVTWLTEQFDLAAKGLYEEQISTNYGFPTKGAALAMKSRLLLLAASPMYNGNEAYANWKNKDGKQLVSQNYDAEKWKKAADAALDVIKMGRYSLLKTDDDSFDAIVENYRKITTTWNDEIIWAKPSYTGWWVNSCLPACFAGWSGRNSSTLELVNDYFMADGEESRPVDEWFENKQFSTEPSNGTVENTFWMFVNREPRFYATVHFPNMEVSYAPSSHPDAKYRLGFWRTGNCGLNVTVGDRPFTGFTPRKHIGLATTSYKGDDGTDPTYAPPTPYPVIRLAEVYLNYCEAMNEYSGTQSHSLILPYLNEIRTRAGLPELSKTFTKEGMRELIRHERRIELVWEGHRFFDVRRWFVAHGVNGLFNKPVHGLDLTRGTSATDPAFFEKTKIQDRTFRIEHYMLPIKASEVAFNENLVQAPFY